MSNDSNLSRRMYDIMDHIGASEDTRRLYQTVGINMEITETITHREAEAHLDSSIFIFGSFCEGTTTIGINSDIDLLVCNDRIPVVENIRDTAGYLVSCLMVRDYHTKPGYVKLQLVIFGIPQTVNTMDMNAADTLDSDRDERICFKHVFSLGKDYERNGPADTLRDPSMQADFVFALRCKTVPDFASEWIRRPRPYCWPSALLIDQMKTSDCFVVVVGHPESDDKHIEWRLSFSLQERQLMFNFNPVQHKCYILLKIIKKDFIKRQLGKSISSYHCKTCMFHVIENTKACIWRPENLFSCVRSCLKELRSYVINGICPNYFVKDENMFDGDVHRNVKSRLTELLTEMITDIPSLLLRIICEPIRGIFYGRTDMDHISETNIQHRQWLTFNITFEEIKLRHDFNRILLKGHELISNCRWCFALIHTLKTREFFKDHEEQQTRETLRHIFSFLYSRIAQQTVSLAVSDVVRETPWMPCLIHASKYYLQKGSTCDVTSSRLVFASVLCKLGQYDSCMSLLDQISADLQPDVERICCCELFKSKIDNYCDYMSSYLTSKANCVTFLPSEMAIVPVPLQFEMFRSVYTPLGSRDYWHDCAVLDGKVYIHVLKYLVYSKLNKIIDKRLSIYNLRWVIENTRCLGHRETGYNILGWIYVQENRIKEGVQCFYESWKIRPHHNAAKWHLGVTVYNQIRSGQ